jgi:hypothetical protein
MVEASRLSTGAPLSCCREALYCHNSGLVVEKGSIEVLRAYMPPKRLAK